MTASHCFTCPTNIPETKDFFIYYHLKPNQNKTKSISSLHFRSRNQITFVIFAGNMTEMEMNSSLQLCLRSGEQDCTNNEGNERLCWTRGLLSASRVWRKRLALKRQKQREDGEERGRQGERHEYGREMEREIERLSEAEEEWRRVGVHSRAASTAAHCGAQPPLCSLLTIRFQALKRPLQQQSYTAQRGCLLMNSSLTKRLLTRCCALRTADSAQIRVLFFFLFQEAKHDETGDLRLPAHCHEEGREQSIHAPPGLCKHVTHSLHPIPAESFHLPWPCFSLIRNICPTPFAFVPEVAPSANTHGHIIELIDMVTIGRQTARPPFA